MYLFNGFNINVTTLNIWPILSSLRQLKQDAIKIAKNKKK